MKDFGFTTHKGRVINYDTNSRELSKRILEKEPSFALCIGCGACAATCSASNFTELSLRRLNVLVKRGENDEVRRTASRCMLCGKCILVCPRGVNTRSVIFHMLKFIKELDGNEV